MLRLAFRTLRLRKGGFIGTFVAVFFGALIVASCGGLMETGIRGNAEPQRLAAAPILVTGGQTFELPKKDPATLDADDDEKFETVRLPERVRLDDGLVSRLRSVPGVSDVVGEVSFPLAAGGQRALGHAWDSAALTPYALTAGAAPKAGEVVVEPTSGLKPGDRVDVAAHGETEPFRVAGVATAPRSITRSAVFFSAADAARLSGYPGKADVIGVFTEPGADIETVRADVAKAAAGATVLSGIDRGVAEFPEAESSGSNLIVIAAVSGGLSVMVAMFVVAGTLSLSTQQRSRELALMRAIGTTPRQLRRMVLGEALAVGLLATALAAAFGPLLGEWLFGQLVENGVVPEVLRFYQGWLPAVVGAGTAMLAVFIAAFVAGRRAGKIRPTEALAEASVTRRWLTPMRVVLAVLCFGGGLALAIVTVAVMTGPIAASTAGPAVILWALGVAMITPGVAKVMTAILQWPMRLLGGIDGRLAVLNTRAGIVRAAGAVTPIMLAVGIATANIYLQTTQQELANQAFTEDVRADAVLGSVAGGLSPDLVQRIQTVPGVAGASEYVTTNVFVEKPYERSDDGRPAIGLTASGAGATTDTKVTQGDLKSLTGRSVALPDVFAKDFGRGIGDTLSLRLGDGTPVEVKVVAVTSQRPGFESLLLPADLLAPHTTAGLAPQMLVRAAPGVDSVTLTERLREATAGQPVTVGDRDALVAAHAKDQAVGAWVNYLMVGMIIAYTVISVANTLVMATMRRRREFGLQRLTGSTRAQVLRMAGFEGGLVAVIGIVLGTVVSAGAIVPFCLVAADSLLPMGSPLIYLSIIGIAAALALAATLVPAWAATRGQPVDAATTGSD
ncbi:FtsX-like permease family protein [Amycolatopsis regifaucium]|uniref:ABC transporter permease n=1 Tax=Amycolatopsis regifaucium TaxID=546365 RepID=A0A154MLC7_9PSEU|nr:ABC transporter permease [Amycolatopsis regifaucium]KZB85076.1 ABC transporter permease [Amycolatopsis regifaucium]OKA04100.1 ABC transporter permease [Amycolatopsis regifaucium]SFH94778.1 putative ABC transport system permease protein [Amycolatopsis regifaucium]